MLVIRYLSNWMPFSEACGVFASTSQIAILSSTIIIHFFVITWRVKYSFSRECALVWSSQLITLALEPYRTCFECNAVSVLNWRGTVCGAADYLDLSLPMSFESGPVSCICVFPSGAFLLYLHRAKLQSKERGKVDAATQCVCVCVCVCRSLHSPWIEAASWRSPQR